MMINVRVDKAKKCNGEYSLYLTFEYSNYIVEAVRSFPTRYWNPDEKSWELPFNQLGKLIAKLPNEDFDISGTFVTLEKPKVDIPKNFSFKTTPYNYQMEGFNYGLQNDRWLLADEMGLGKTKQVIDIAVARKKQYGYKHCLIVCGVNGLKWNWVNEVAIHSNEKAYILGQRTKSGKTFIGTTQDKIEDIKDLRNNDAYFIITNVETLRHDQMNTELGELCKRDDIEMVAIDEIHRCKNASSQQGKGILKLQSKCRIAMTGTPLLNNPLETYIILKWLGYEKNAFYSFKGHYAVMGGYGNYQVVGYKNLSELQDRLNDIMLRRLKEDVLDLPEKIFIDEYVDMTPKQKQIYDEVTQEIKANIDQIKMANNPLAELIRMRQATGYTGILSSKVKESAKLERMEELVEEAVENGRKVVVFSNWKQMTDEVVKRLKKYGPAVITGDTKDAERQSMVNKFQNDDNCNVIVGTIGAMGTGITLTEGTIEIFLDEPWNMATKDQAIDRCHRVGQKNNITIYTLMCKGSIDERIHNIVEKKGAMAQALVDGDIVTNKIELLEYLIG